MKSQKQVLTELHELVAGNITVYATLTLLGLEVEEVEFDWPTWREERYRLACWPAVVRQFA